MDCPSEEQLIRAAVRPVANVVRLEFDLIERSLSIWHTGEVDAILHQLEGLKLGARLVETEPCVASEAADVAPTNERNVLRLLLAINAVMFVVEGAAGWIWQSAGLLSDSLDMLADATVYGLALWAVGHAASQRHAARVAGWVEFALALGVLIEVGRRSMTGSTPEGAMMMATSALALVANVTCMLALSRHRTGGLHMQASWIFSTNDVIANLGVILAGGLVLWTSSRIPDLVIGALIGLVVLRGALRILRLTRVPEEVLPPADMES